MLDNKGLSMVQVMVSGALLAAIGIASMKMIQNQKKVETDVGSSSDINRYSSQIHNAILNREACEKTLNPTGGLVLNFSPLNIGPTADPAITPVQNIIWTESLKKMFNDDFYQYSLNEGDAALKNFKRYNWVIGDMYIERVMRSTTHQEFNLTVEFLSTNINALGAKRLLKRFPLSLSFETDGITFKNCYSDIENAIDTAVERSRIEFCEQELNGTFNTGTNKCDYTGLKFESSAVKQIIGGAPKIVNIFPASQWDACFLVGAGKTTSTKKRKNRHNYCQVYSDGTYWKLQSSQAHSAVYCKAQCIRVR